MKKSIEVFLSNVFLFKDIEIKELKKLLNNISIETGCYNAKEVIFSQNEHEEKLAFLVSGECIIQRVKSDGGAIPLNILKKFDSFGIMSLFTNEEFPTCVVAKRSAEIIFLSKPDVEKLISISPKVAINVITFLANRVAFLNSKIATFSSDSVEKKFAKFLTIQEKKYGSIFSFNCKKTSEAINSGRASLYRAISAMQEEKIIKLENKKIFILDREGLERISK